MYNFCSVFSLLEEPIHIQEKRIKRGKHKINYMKRKNIVQIGVKVSLSTSYTFIKLKIAKQVSLEVFSTNVHSWKKHFNKQYFDKQ